MMHVDKLRLVGVAAYIVGDIIYVLSSTSFYAPIFERIRRGKPMPDRKWALVAAWTVMALGWYYLAAPMAVKWAPQIGCPYRAGILAGVLYGLAVYGTYNFTMAITIPEWSPSVIARDLGWGIFWASLTLAFYTAKATGMPLSTKW